MGSRFWQVVGAAFVGMLGFGAVIPMLPVYLHEQRGASTFVTGLLIGLASAFALAGRFWAGRVADRNGRRVALLIGMALCCVAGVLYLPVFGLWAIAPARVLHGLGEGFFITATVAWVVDIAPAHRRAQALGFLSSGIWGGVSVGPAIGQALGSMARVAGLLMVSSLAVIGMVLLFRMQETLREVGRPGGLPRAVILPGIVLGFGNVTYAVMSGFLILMLRQRGITATWAFSAFAFAVLFGRTIFGGFPDRMGPRKTLYGGYVMLAAGLTAVALCHNAVVAVAASLLVGLGYSTPWTALAVVVVNRVRPTERASALAALTAFYDLFVAGSSAVAGAVASRFGLTSIFWMALGCVGCATLVVRFTRLGAEGPTMVHAALHDSAEAKASGSAH